MFGCQNMMAAQADHAASEQGLATIVSGEACASSGSHDCCAKKKAESKAKTQIANNRVSLKLATQLSQAESLNPRPSSEVRECPLALSRSVTTTKATDSKQFTDSIATALARPVTSDSQEQHTALSPLARLPNRGHTYLRCCVLLI